MRQYPHARLIRCDAAIVVAAWLLLPTSLAAFLVLALLSPGAVHWAYYGIYFALAVAALHILLALIHRCPVCSNRPMVEGFAPAHPASLPQSKLRGWAGVAWSVFRRRRFTCIHCGTEYTCEQ